MPVPSPSDLSSQFATAYFEAAQGGADMRHMANVLETLREQLAQAVDPYGVWTALYDQIGAAEPGRCLPVLVKLTQAFQSAVISADVAWLRKSFKEDRDKGWNEWLDAYVRSFDAGGWRVTYSASIAQQALSYSPHPDWTVERIQNAAQAVVDERWAEAYDWFLFLAESSLPAEFRARFFAMAAEIHIFYFLQLTKARTYLQKSTELAPDLLLARNAWGEYWTAMGKWDDARKTFREMTKSAPKRPEGYVGLGDCDEKTGQLASAESWYYQAVLNAPGSFLGYRSLVALWLRPDYPSGKADPAKVESQIQPLLLRWKSLLERPATASLSVGIGYKNAKQFEQAERYLQESIQSDPSAAISHVWLGYTRMDEGDQTQQSASPAAGRLYASALDEFNTAIRLAPAALDGYWGVSWLYMQQQNWTEAESWTRRCLELHPEWESFVRVRLAEVLRRQGRLAEADAELARSLEIESVNQGAMDVLSSLVDDFRGRNQGDEARRALEVWKEKSDPALAYLYFNRLANWSYEAGDYATAVGLYREAIKVKETDPVLHSNLAGALERLKTPGKRCQELQEAIAEFERSNELLPQEDLPDKISALRAERTFLEFYGEASAAYIPVADAVRVYIDWEVMPEILTGANLTADTTDAVNSVRSRLKEQFGFVLPGVNFRDIQPPGSGEYRIVFNESTTYTGRVSAGSVLSVVLGRLEEVVQGHMAEFVGHDAVAGMLKTLKSPAAQSIVKDMARLTPLVAVLRSRLARRESIEPLAGIVEDFARTAGAGNIAGAPLMDKAGEIFPLSEQTFPKLAVKVGGSDPEVAAALQGKNEELQKAFFDEFGLPLPPIAYELDSNLPEGAAVILLNGRQVNSTEKLDGEEIGRSLREGVADLIVPEVTSCFLARLRDRYPVLVRAVQARLDLNAITSFLRTRLQAGQSIKNLPGILEDELQERVTAPVVSSMGNEIQTPSYASEG
jgi:tetratricopeptide (TPR) repeat protein